MHLHALALIGACTGCFAPRNQGSLSGRLSSHPLKCMHADASADEADGADEVLVSSDINPITDDDLRTLLAPLQSKKGVKLTFLAGARPDLT